MQGWRVDAVVSWAVARDLAGPSKVLHENAVNGQDLLDADEDLMVKGLRLTPFAARKVLRARGEFLGFVFFAYFGLRSCWRTRFATDIAERIFQHKFQTHAMRR